MNARLNPLISEFETEAQAESHDRWLRAKVRVALDDPRPSVPHDEAMARIDSMLKSKADKPGAAD